MSLGMFGTGVKTDLWGRKRPAQEVRREILAENRRRGREGEEIAKTRLALQGYEVERTGRGSDYRARKRDLFTGKVVESRLVEVKTGSAKLSRLQRRTKPRIMRVQTWFG
jgi:HJR/Mrr/RecB family endonuclease